MKTPRRIALGLAALLLTAIPAAGSDAGWDRLVEIDAALTKLGSPTRVDGVPQLDEAAIAARRTELERARADLATLDPSAWSVAGKVDFLLVWARANALEFEHRVTRPWARDPIFWLNQVRRVPWADVEDEDLETSLAAVAPTLAQARAGLTEPFGELADLAVFHLENFDGVGQGEPYRDEPPGGTIAWYEDLVWADRWGTEGDGRQQRRPLQSPRREVRGGARGGCGISGLVAERTLWHAGLGGHRHRAPRLVLP